MNRKDSSRICEAPVTSASESGSANRIRSYLRVGALQERAAVVDVPGHPRVVVGLVGVLLHADLQDPRVDVDRVDMVGALAQRDRDVGAGAGADDQHVVERVAGRPLVGRPVNSSRLLQLPLAGAIIWCGTPLTAMQEQCRARRRSVVGWIL